MRDYWVPTNKDQLIFWLTCRYGQEARKKYERMTKGQLYAIYFKIQEDLIRQIEKSE